MTPVWIPRDLVLAMHLRQLSEHGGGTGVRDSGMLESALSRAEHKLADGTPDLFDLAAAYAYGIARNYPFVDGNKRTALVASFTFLYINGYAVTTSQDKNVTAFVALASGELQEDALAKWFRENTRKL